MNILEIIYSAFSNVYNYKIRSILTMLGIIIGVSSVIMIMSIGEGVKDAMNRELESFNLNNINVQSNNYQQAQLTLDDARAISELNNVSGVANMSRLFDQRVQLRNPSETRIGMAFGLDHNYSNVEVINMGYGRFITEQDVNNNAYVAVISAEMSRDVFGYLDSVGESLQVEGPNGRYYLTVIGVLEESDAILAQTPLNFSIFLLPVTTAGIISDRPNSVDTMSVTMVNSELSLHTSQQISTLLDIRHNTNGNFSARSGETARQSLDNMFTGVTAFVAFVASISLFVGGVGVMNIMMVTVTERTREIGIRKSLGATNNLIKLQFVFESAILTSLGGIIGVLLGVIGANILGNVMMNILYMEIVPTINILTMVFAISVSMLVGIVFGVYPAAKAAKLDPVDALRYE